MSIPFVVGGEKYA